MVVAYILGDILAVDAAGSMLVWKDKTSKAIFRDKYQLLVSMEEGTVCVNLIAIFRANWGYSIIVVVRRSSEGEVMVEIKDLEVVSRTFGIKLNIPYSNNIPKELFVEFYRQLIKKYPNKFDNFGTAKQADEFFVIVNTNNDRNIACSRDFAQYTENKKNFNYYKQIAEDLYVFYTEKLCIKPEDFKLIGNLYAYRVVLSTNATRYLSEKFRFLLDEQLSSFEIKGISKRDKYNIHMSMVSSDEFLNDDSDRVVIINVDINNKDQTSGLSESSFSETMSFVEKYLSDELCKILSGYL